MLRPAVGLLLLLLPFGLLGARGCATRPSLLVVGIDGGDWEVMDPLIEAGYLPNLGRVVQEGVRAELTCFEALPQLACFCPPVWNTIATGQDASKHKMTSLTSLSTARPINAIWDVVKAFGGTSTVLAMRNTWPTEPGINLNFTEEGLDVASTLIYERWGGGPYDRAADERYHTQPAGLFQTLGLLPHEGPRVGLWSDFARDRVSMEALRRLSRIVRTDFTFIVLHGPDKAEHLHWGSIQAVPKGPIDEVALLARAAAYTGPVVGPAPWSFGSVTSQYQEADAWLGTLLSRVHYDYIMLVSDHGMERNPVDTGLAGYHGAFNALDQPLGIFALSGPGVRSADLGVVSVFDMAPTMAYLMAVPVGFNLPGRVLGEAFEGDWLARYPVAGMSSWERLPAKPPVMDVHRHE